MHCLESVNKIELRYSIPMNFNFLFSDTEVSDRQLNQKKAIHNQTK